MYFESVFLLKKELPIFISFRLKIVMHSLLFGLFASLFIYQLLRIPYQSIHVIDWAKFILPLLLVPINWYLEYKKWYLQLNFLKLPQENAHRSFAAGMVSDFIIPGIPTNFVGRIMYFDSSKRIALTTWTQITNGIQFLITLLCGMLSIFVLNKGSYLSGVVLLVCFGLLNALWLFPSIRGYIKKKFPGLFDGQIKSKTAIYYLIKIGFLSIIRMIVFTLQFLFFLNAFGIPFTVDLLFWIWLSYLSVTFSPSLFFGKLFVRESVTVAVFQLGNYAATPVLLASFAIWFFNGFIPTAIAWLITISKK